MNESKAQLFPSALAKNNNRNHFVTNQHQAFIEEQQAINKQLKNCIEQLDKSYQTILEALQKQETTFSTQLRSQRHHYLQLKNMLHETSGNFETYVNKQVRSINLLNKRLGKQAVIGKMIVNRTDEVSNRLQQSVNKQELLLKNIDKKQDIYAKKLLEQLETNEDALTNSIKKQDQTMEEIKSLFDKISSAKGSLSQLLSSLPPNYPVKQIIVEGVAISVEALLFVNTTTGLAFFTTDNDTFSVAIDKIEAILWE